MMDGGIMRSQRGGGSSFGAPAGFDSYAWAARPAAAAYSGQIIRITDVGPSAGSLFISDGTYWGPLNGHLTLFSGAELGLSTTSSSAAIMGALVTIPAKLFQKPGSFIRGTMRGRRTGTLGSGGVPILKIGWGAAAGQYFAGIVFSGSNDSASGNGFMARVNDTQARMPGNGSNFGYNPSSDNNDSVLYTLSATADLTISAIGSVSGTPGAGETAIMDEAFIELIVP